MNRALLLHLGIFVIGFLFVHLFKAGFDPIFRVLVALPVGWALFGISAVAVYSLYFAAASQQVLLVVLAALALALVFANIGKRSLSRDSLVLGGAALLVLAAAGIVVDALRILTTTSDSAYIARFGQNIGLGNYEGSRIVFSKWGPFVPLIHSLTKLLGQKLYWQYQPVLSLDLVAIVFYTAYTLLREALPKPHAATAAAVAVGLMAFSNMFVFHAFYIHVNLVATSYMYLLVFALANMQDERRTGACVALAQLSLIAFTLVRIEAALFAIVILLIATFQPGWSSTARLRLSLPFILVSLAWYARAYFILPETPDLLTKDLGLALCLVLLGFGAFVAVSGVEPVQPLLARTPMSTLFGLVVVALGFTAMRPRHMLTSLQSMVRNMLVDGQWGLTWYVVFFVGTLLYFAGRDTRGYDWILVVAVAYVVAVYDLAYFTEPYHPGEFDSANRLLLQVVPVVVLYLARRYVACATAVPDVGPAVIPGRPTP